MSFRSKNSLIISVVWFVILIVMVITFAPDNYTSIRKLISAVAIFFGVWIDIWMLARNKKDAFDERILKLTHKSSSVSMIITLMFVFIFCIVLSEVYPDTVNSSWFWMLGYLMIAVANISSGLSFIYFDLKGIPYED